MFSILVAVFEVSMLVSFLLFIPLTLALRIQTVTKNKIPFKQAILIILVPFSLGYYYFLKAEQRNKYYNSTLVLFLVITSIGILFTVYQWIPPFLNP